MRIFFGTALMLAVGCSDANAFELTKTATSGRSALVYSYAHWKRDCSPDLGVIKVLAKPEHGKLSPRQIQGTIKHRGRRVPGPVACIGKPTPMFEVYYTSEPHFRGTDSFKIEVSYRGNRSDIDTFTVNVQ